MGLLDDIKKAKDLKEMVESGKINDIIKEIADNTEVKKELCEMKNILVDISNKLDKIIEVIDDDNKKEK